MRPEPCKHSYAQNSDMVFGIPIFSCPDCSLVFQKTEPGYDPHKHYEQFYQNETPSRFPGVVEGVIRLFRLFRSLKLFTISPKAKTILDIGCGRGFTLYFLKNIFRWKRTAGTQIAFNAYRFAKDRLGLEVYNQDLLQIPFEEGGFDIVSMWHVLEHIPESDAYLTKIRSLIRPGGKFIVEVPNHNSWSRKLAGQYWLGWDIENHFHFFNPVSLRRLFESHGFEIKMIHSFSLEYSTFISAQSLASACLKSDHEFWKSLQGKPHHLLKAIAEMILILIVAPFCLMINLLLFFSTHGEILLVSGQRSQN